MEQVMCLNCGQIMDEDEIIYAGEDFICPNCGSINPGFMSTEDENFTS